MEQQRVRKTYQYKLMPTPEQERSLETVLWRCRELYNAGLQERKDAWETCGVSVTFALQSAQLPGINAVRPDYRDINAQVLQDVLHRLDNTFQAFFRRLKASETPGYPRFQSRNRYNSFAYPQVGEHGGAVLDGRALSLSKIGRIPIRVHRPREGTPKIVTSSKEADGWHACLWCAEVPAEPLPVTGKETGIDVGLKVFLVTADGEIVANPRHYRKAEKPLAKAQRRVSRRKQGGKRRTKAVKLLARAHQQVQRQRRDFHQKTALALVREYDTIYLEDLQARNLSRRPQATPDGNGGYLHNGAAHKVGRNQSLHDAGWYAFRRILTCKAAWAGKRVEAVPQAYTIQDCSGCGERVYKRLFVRNNVCTNCGLMLDRDENAARNMRRAGQAPQALTWPGAASVA